jgi:hypothetical protein
VAETHADGSVALVADVKIVAAGVDILSELALLRERVDRLESERRG